MDIVLGSYLRTRGYILDHVEKEGNKGNFFFADIPEEIINDYFLGKALCEPQALNNNVKLLTTLCRRPN